MCEKRLAYGLTGLFLLAVAGVLLLMPPIAQDRGYHAFADSRGWLGIPNFADVASNLAYILSGLAGLAVTWRYRRSRSHFIDPREIWFAAIAFAGILLVGFGSGYYHWAPDSGSLVWDRLPMTIGFMAIFAMMIAERVSLRAGLVLLPVLLAAGMASVWYWHATEQAGQGDLRPYALVQFFPVLVIPLMMAFGPARYRAVRYLWYIIGWYVAAKLLEQFDAAIFHLTAETVSGHTLKHLASGLATLALVQYIRHRRPA